MTNFLRFVSNAFLMVAFLASSLAPSGAQGARAATAPATGQPRPEISTSVKNDLSLPLAQMTPPAPTQSAPASLPPDLPLRTRDLAGAPVADLAVQVPAAIQSAPPAMSMPAPLKTWEGNSNADNQSLSGQTVVPPDPSGDVGPNHYVQWTNLSITIWDKQGTLLLGPLNGNALWSGFGGTCQTSNDGDPIVLYDALADRWMVSQFALPASTGPFYQCVAVSQTPDPTGAWYRYAFQWSSNIMNDYPKFGVWPDGYYLSVNQFLNSDAWSGAGVAVLERAKMLAGQPARILKYDLGTVDLNFGSLLPADLDGSLAPPSGAPCPFLEWDDASIFGGSDALREWDFHVDWNNLEAGSSFGLSQQPNLVLPTADYEPRYSLSNWVHQPGTSPGLDPISDRLMFRLQYRNFGSYQTLVSNHTVDVGTRHAGVAWFELRKNSTGTWSLYQQGVFAPDGNDRWMGSAAMDRAGNIAVGYSLSGTSTYPSIAYAGRLAADPLGTLSQGERVMTAGGGSQKYYNRWGDYSMLSVDPVDDCTFWYTQEYYSSDSYGGWRTRIGAFIFPGCAQPGTGTITGTVRDAATSLPLAGVKVSVGEQSTVTAANGSYSLVVSEGTADVTAWLFGYASQTSAATVAKDASVTLNFALVSVALVTVSGVVRDGGGHVGMPLYARIDIPTLPTSPLYSDPLTGAYTVQLMQDTAFSFSVTALSGGYDVQTRSVTPPAGGSTQNFDLTPAAACNAPGYQAGSTPCTAITGGLVVGIVRDGNNLPSPAGAALTGATVSDATAGVSATSAASPAGLYVLFSGAGARTLTAAYAGYQSQSKNITVTANATQALDFALPAGYITAAPTTLSLSVPRLSPLASTSFQLNNSGTAGATFTLGENSGTPPGLAASGPFARATRRISPARLMALSAERVFLQTPPAAAAWAGGGANARAWATGLAAPWGLGLAVDGTLWLNDAASGGGDGLSHAFDAQGTALAGTLPAGGSGVFAADFASDVLRGRMWQVEVGGSNCIYELDPAAGTVTGNRVCPQTATPLRGLAYDTASDTFFGGSWNDSILYHFDRSGRMLDSLYTGLNLAGLAYHPGTGHIYVLANNNVGFDVYVLAGHYPYTLLGGFDLPGMTDFGQAGLELSPQGDLLAVDVKGRQVIVAASGEGAFTPLADVAWLAATPTSASLAQGAAQTVTVNVDATGLSVGSYNAYLNVATNTPYDNTASRTAPVTVTLNVLPAHGAALAPTLKKGYARRGWPAVYTITLTNAGDYDESYTLSAGTHAWTTDLPAAPVVLKAGASANLTFAVHVPLSAAIGQSDAVTITVTSSAAPAVSQSVTLTTVVALETFLPWASRTP